MARLWRLVDRRALVVTLFCLVAWRLLSQIPLTQVTVGFMMYRLESLGGSGLFVAIGPDSLPFSADSVGSEGIGPYVSALIVMSLVAAISSRVKAMAADVHGRLRLARWTRALAIALALGQAYGLTVLYQNTNPPVFGLFDWATRLAVCLEVAGGTAIMILLADVLDEFGLGFGNGALVFYALGLLASEVHRIADYFASTPSVEALYRPLAVWAAFTLGLTVAGVAILLAVRPVQSPATRAGRKAAPTELRLLVSGVLRPPSFAIAVLFLPTIVANYYVTTHAAWVHWFVANWGPYGSSFWLDAVYVAVYAALVVLAALIVARYDDAIVPAPSHLTAHMNRLALISGLLLALAVVAAPVANHLVTNGAGELIPLNGAEILLVVAMILMTVRAIEGHRGVVPFTASPSGLP